MKKILAMILALTMVLSMSFAFAEGDEIVINFLGAQYSDKTEPYLKQLCADFEAENPGVKVNLEIVGWADVNTRAAALIGAGQAPDLYNGASAAEYEPDGLLYNIKDIVSEELQADFYPSFLENNRSVIDGELYAIPYVASVRALYCNAKIFEEVGIESAPKTWTEVEEACQKIYDYYNGEVYAWGIDASSVEGQTMIAYYGWSNGGGYVDEDENYILNCDANVEGLEWAYKLYQNGWTNANPTIENRDDLQKLFAEDKLAMLITACFFPSLYPDTEMIIGEIPYNDANCDASSTLGVQDGLLIFNDSAKSSEDSPEKKEAITKFLDYFYAPEHYVQFMINEGLLPATQSGAEALAEQAPEQAAYLDVLSGARFYPRTLTNWNEAQTVLKANDQEIFLGSMTAREALDATQEEVG